MRNKTDGQKSTHQKNFSKEGKQLGCFLRIN